MPAVTNGKRKASSQQPHAGPSKAAAVDEDFIMTLDSDDEEDPAEATARGDQEEEAAEASANEESSLKSRRPTAQLSKREKIIDGKGKGKAPPSMLQPGEELALDRGFSFDVDEVASGHDGWNFDVQTGRKGVNGGEAEDRPITVDDIIEKKRKNRGDLDLPILAEDDDEEEAEPEWTGFDDNGDDLASGNDEAEAEESEDEDAFGGGLKPIESDDSDEEDEDEEDEYPSDDEEEVDEADEANSDVESDQETEVDKARKAAYFASEAEGQGAAKKGNASGPPDETTSSFQSFSLTRSLLRGLADLSFSTPTPIQSRTIPIALAGKDIVAGAVTGSGKTAAFMIPILERLAHRPKGQSQAKTRVVVLTPTRELAVQCWNVGKALGKHMDIRFCLAVGGLSVKSQEQELKLRPEVVIATPGRLIDHIRNSASFGIEDIEILVMDEADRMLEEGFAAELNEIIQSTPRTRQTMLFSATMTDDVDELVRLSLKRPVRLFVDPKRTTATRLVQEFVRVRGSTGAEGGDETSLKRRSEAELRPALLLSLCLRTFRHQVIVFVRSKKLAHQLKILFGLMGLSAAEMHGDLTQQERLDSLQSFKESKVDFLLATDVLSRGVDIKGVQTVINYDMPTEFDIYLHRVGRTARAGRNGRSVTLVGENDRRLLKQVLKSAPASQIKHRLIPNDVVSSIADRLTLLKGDVDEVLKEEKEEKALRQAEMELKKGTNMIEHRDEIMSRPKRTWFQTEKEKNEHKEISSKEYIAKVDSKAAAIQAREQKRQEGKHDRFSGLSRKQKRTKVAREELAAEEGGAAALNAGIRSAKKQARPKELGIPEPKKGQKIGKARPFGKGKKSRSSTGEGKVGKKGVSGFARDLGEKRSSGGGGGASPAKARSSKGGSKGGKR